MPEPRLACCWVKSTIVAPTAAAKPTGFGGTGLNYWGAMVLGLTGCMTILAELGGVGLLIWWVVQAFQYRALIQQAMAAGARSDISAG